jgi:hypothetical protein
MAMNKSLDLGVFDLYIMVLVGTEFGKRCADHHEMLLLGVYPILTVLLWIVVRAFVDTAKESFILYRKNRARKQSLEAHNATQRAQEE